MRRSAVFPVFRKSLAWLTIIALLVVAEGCVRRPVRPSPQKVQTILARGGSLAESSFYSCLLSGYYQGIALAELKAKCETELAIDDEKGFGGRGGGDFGSLGPGSDQWFDPASVSTACNSGNPAYAGPDGQNRNIYNVPGVGPIDYGTNSWGGAGECDKDGCYKGLSEAESAARKLEAMRAANEAILAVREANEEAAADPDNAEKQKAAEEARKAADEAIDKAKADPNKEEKKDPPLVSGGSSGGGSSGTGRPSGQGSSTCDEALQAAREILRECQRVGWKGGRCEQLKARLSGCADPLISFIDPESGYTCGEAIDTEALKDAYVARCREVTRPDPNGPDPCVPPTFESSGRFAHHGPGEDLCNNLVAIVDPDSPQCLRVVTIPRFGRSVEEVILWGLNKLGGPIVVLPTRGPGPSPNPGPDPRPGPNP